MKSAIKQFKYQRYFCHEPSYHHHMPHNCHVLPRLLWLCCYMSQMNPLIGPELDRKALAAMSFYWGNLHE